MYVARCGRSCMACNTTAANTAANTLIEIGKAGMIVLCPKCREALKVSLALDAMGGTEEFLKGRPIAAQEPENKKARPKRNRGRKK